MKMPATTMVAAWMRAETGVGPAMASGSHVWRMNWPDFDMTAAMSAEAGDQQQGVVVAAGDAVGELVDLDDVEGAGGEEQDDHAHEQADVADAVGEERLEGGVGVGLLLPPVADERERADADELPAR